MSPPPRKATLAEVYPIDFGLRTIDLPLWRRLLGTLPTGATVLEVGCGDGRVLAGVGWDPARWVGVDIDPEMIARIEAKGARGVCGDAAAAETWRRVTGLLSEPVGAVLIPYSSIYLLPHRDQGQAVEYAVRHLAPGGFLAVEVFTPAEGALRRERWTSRKDLGDVRGERWERFSVFKAAATQRTTEVVRQYGPAGRPILEIDETICWRFPAEMLALAGLAGMPSSKLLMPPAKAFGGNRCVEAVPEVPEGHVVLFARKP